MRRLIAVAVATTAFVTVGAASMAAAEPGGWAAWRVALFAWPFAAWAGVVVALTLAATSEQS